MIVCSCNVISDKQIKKALRQIKHHDPKSTVSPELIYQQLSKQLQCGNCRDHVIEIIDDERRQSE